jgi:predicted dehydrogenase
MSENKFHRRDVLRLGAAAGLAAGLGPMAMAQQKPAPIRVGVIGTGGRGTYLLQVALGAGAEVPALCDIREPHLNQAIAVVAKARDGRKPAGYSGGPKDYRRMLQRDDLDAVIVGTPMQVHAEMSIDALRAGKHVLSEVAAAMTMDECWGLVRAAEETGRVYMLSENCCYWQPVMMIRNMVRKGIFGELTFAECGYVHQCLSLAFEGDGTLTWRGEMLRDNAGNVYPTHSFGPVAQWLDINRGDRIVSLAAMNTRRAGMAEYVKRRFPENHPARKIDFQNGDSTTALIRTAKGVLIDLRYDIISSRPVPSTTYHALQGSKASYESRIGSIWIDGRSKDHAWEPVEKYAKEFEDPLWTSQGQEAAGSGHGGADYFVVRAFLDAVRKGGPSPIDACDAAAWSAIIPLSNKSIAEGGKPQEFPDFTRGKWETRKA